MKSITELLGCSAQRFINEIWGKNSIFHQGGAEAHVEQLPSLKNLDDLYFSLSNAGSQLGVVDGHAAPSAGTSLIRSDGRVALDELHNAYRKGLTLLTTHLQNSHLGVARLARDLEIDFFWTELSLRKEIGANLFLTPPASRGFEPHYDGHDVLIIQLEGEKHWEIYDQISQMKVGMEGEKIAKDMLGIPCDTPKLRKGDVLYISRGMPHVAYTDEQNSLHLTLSIVPLTWTDLISESLASRSDIDERITTAVVPSLVLSSEEASDLQRRLTDKWLNNLHTIPEFSPWRDQVGETKARIRLAKHVMAKVDVKSDGDSVEIKLPGSTIRLGPDAIETVELLLNGQIVTTDKIKLGGRTKDSKTRFLVKLVELGFASPV